MIRLWGSHVQPPGRQAQVDGFGLVLQSGPGKWITLLALMVLKDPNMRRP